MSDLTCPEGNAFSISGCNTLCLVCELLVEDPCPPCSIGADKVGTFPVWLVVPRRLRCFQISLVVRCFQMRLGGWGTKVGDVPEVLFSDELGCALFSDELGGWGTKVGDFPEVLFSDELVVRCFQMSGGWGTKVGDFPEVLFSDELGCALFSDELGCALFSDELGCALFSDELGGWGTKVGDFPEVLFSDRAWLCVVFR